MKLYPFVWTSVASQTTELSMISPPLNVNISCLCPLSNIFFLSHSVQFQVSISVILLT